MKNTPPTKDVSTIDFSNEVQGGGVHFHNTSIKKFSKKHTDIVRGLVKSVLSLLRMEDCIIRVDLVASATIDNASGEAYPVGVNEHGVSAFGIDVKAQMLKDVVGDDGKVCRRSLTYLSETIAHELVHCKQYKENWLVYDKAGNPIWKGQLKDEKDRYFDDVQYRKKPWEVMAFAAEKSLGKAAIQDLIGQAIVTPDEGMYIPKTDAEKAIAARHAIRVAEKAAEKLSPSP